MICCSKNLKGKKMTTNLAIFPLPLVLLPGEYLPLRIFEARYLDMVANCLRQQEPFVLSPVLDNDQKAMHLNMVGTTAKIIEWDKKEEETLHIVVKGAEKVVIDRPSSKNNGLIIAETTSAKDYDSGLSEQDMDFLMKSIEINNSYDLTKSTINSRSAIAAAYEIASLVNLNPIQKFSILSEKTGTNKLRLIEKYLGDFGNSDISVTLH